MPGQPHGVTRWAGSALGCDPIGSAVAWPELAFAFPEPQLGARDQSVPLIVDSNLWGKAARLRFSNALGNGPLPLALDFLRDALSLSRVTCAIWLEGIHDFSDSGRASAAAVQSAMGQTIKQTRSRWPQLRVLGAALVSALGSSNEARGSSEEDNKRQALNAFVRNAGCFDASIKFDRVMLGARSGAMRVRYVPNSPIGGPGDKPHPDRAGYLAMSMSIALDMLVTSFDQR